jgi:hypothetical protein
LRDRSPPPCAGGVEIMTPTKPKAPRLTGATVQAALKRSRSRSGVITKQRSTVLQMLKRMGIADLGLCTMRGAGMDWREMSKRAGGKEGSHMNGITLYPYGWCGNCGQPLPPPTSAAHQCAVTSLHMGGVIGPNIYPCPLCHGTGKAGWKS